MPRPDTVPELLDVARRSGLLAPDQLALATVVLGSLPDDALTDAVEWLGAGGRLTPFQIQRLAAGRWRGLRLGGYRLLDKLGAGGMGTVYLAAPEEGPAGRVAIKVLARPHAADPLFRERFRREASAAAGLDHPNVVRVLAVEPDADSPYFVMEYADGVTLQAAVARGGTFGAGAAADCGRQIALGLAAAHEQGLVHRDVKPANAIVTRAGRVQLLDLGIVRVPDSGELTRRQEPGAVLGTADYLAPEQAIDSSDVDIRADIYALGATLYFLLAGRPPFGGLEQAELLDRKQHADPPPLGELRPDLPPGLAAAVGSLMARDPAGRPASPLAAAATLAPWAAPEADFPARLFGAPPPRADGPTFTPAGPLAPTAFPAEGPPTARMPAGTPPASPPNRRRELY